jgi:hypothetical protein
MSIKLLLKDVVARAELNRRTARYVLDRAKSLKVRHAAGQGEHRQFSVDEAIRLAMCTRFVMFGVPLPMAEHVTEQCEQEFVRSVHFPRLQPTPHLFWSEDRDSPWRLRLVNGRLLEVWQHPNEPTSYFSPEIDGEYYDLVERKTVGLSDAPPHLPRVEWSLTDLAVELAKAKP